MRSHSTKQILTRYRTLPVRKEPNYLFLTISLLTAVVLITSARPEGPLMTLGITVAACSFMVTSYFVIESRCQLLLATLLGMAANPQIRVMLCLFAYSFRIWELGD